MRGTNWLGDAVMSTPALLRLREKFPEATLALLSPEKLGELWRHHPAVDEVITFGPDQGLPDVARKLRAGRFDCALVLPNSPRSVLEVFLARIPRRIGYARSWRSFLLTQSVPARAGAVPMRKRSQGEIKRLATGRSSADRPPPSTAAHQIHEYLHLAAALGVPTWLLLPFAPDWRWTLDGDSTPWYPTARLFRQTAPGDWPGVIAAVEAALKLAGV